MENNNEPPRPDFNNINLDLLQQHLESEQVAALAADENIKLDWQKYKDTEPTNDSPYIEENGRPGYDDNPESAMMVQLKNGTIKIAKKGWANYVNYIHAVRKLDNKSVRNLLILQYKYF